MAGELSKEDDNNAVAARKRPLDGKENNNVGLRQNDDAANNDNGAQHVNLCNSAKKKSRPGSHGSYSDNDDIEVLSPPPKPGSGAADGRQPQQQQQASNSGTGAHSDNDECVLEWSNATNPNVNLPHLRPNCGVHNFATDPVPFCEKCYCVTCDKLASECDDWDTHCRAQEAERKKPQEDDSIEIDGSPSPALQSYYARNTAALTMNQRLHGNTNNNNDMDDGSEDDDYDDHDNRMHEMMSGNNRSPFDSHFSKAYNEQYDNENKKERGRNPKDMRIPEILADKLMSALVLAEEASSKAYSNNNVSSTSDKPTKGKPKDDKKNATANNKSAMELFSSQDLQRKERYERSQMEGDIPQLGLHPSFFVEGVRIGWPYPSILKPQRQMAIHLIKALKNSRHVVLESPTVRV